ncbi:protein argonaute 18 isoform X1 [Brachypodium distachyon]|uniref:protein argonaute 18 isoform X1 n=1 Tax=Brachypodium distachyon TaxID=15368 RepID=UPI000D0DCD8C|nr:protein argonaute 18 isoform X1 [Brachypodium distachyon]|eukprot:XP_024310310.1 protein argonaute 18 isoform X1 [Brachypodium distachyon]
MANRGGRGGHDGGQHYGGRDGGGGGGQYYGGRGGGGRGNVEGGDGRGRGYYRGGGDGGGRRGRGYYQGEGDVRGFYQGRGGDGGRGNQGRGYHGGGEGVIRGRGRGYQGDGDVRGRGRGYDGGGDRGRGRGRGYQQGGNDYGRGRGGYQQQGGDNYGGGRGGRGGGGYPDWPQPVGPPLAERYATEAAQLREKFKAMDISRAEPTFPARPGFGSAGKACIVKANHFFVGLVDKGLHQYDVTVSPEPTLTGVYRAVMSRLVSEHQHTSLGGRLPAYDGRKTLYTAGQLPFNSKEFEVILSDNKTGSSGHSRERKYVVAIKHVTLVSLQQLQMLMAGYSTDIPSQALQVLDIVLRDMILNERSDMGYVVVGRSFFSASIDDPRHLGLGIEGWKGFYQSIRPTQSGLSLNIDMSSTAFVKAQSVIKFVQDILKKPDLRHVTGPDCQKIKKALKGVRVEVTHRGDVRRKYCISGLAGTARDLRFQSSTGVSKTVMDYFRETYKLQLRYDFLPCLDVGTTQKPNYLPMEVCNIVPGQRYQKKLDENQVSNMMQITCQQPLQREGFIRQTVRCNNYNNTKRANEFGIEVDYEPTSVQARVLPAPMLKYHPSGSDNMCNPSNGAWNMRGKKVVDGARVVNWLCINFCVDLPEADVRRFCNGLSNMCCNTGLFVNIGGLKLFSADPLKFEANLHNVRNFCQQTRQMSGVQKIDLLLALLPDKNDSLYGDIKRICETDIGVMSQCCLRKNVLKSSPQFFANVAIKINAKCGGRNSVFANRQASLPVVSAKPTIIFGADVTHPSALDDATPSIASVVASKDWPEVTKYHGVVRAQGHREELIQGLEDIVRELLRSFEKESNRRPEQLIFYRDGVSEGQFKQVLEKEIPEIEKAWKAIYNEEPQITFIVVQKRHHTRLFPNNHSDMSSKDSSGNVLPGTVVDRQVCHPTEFDFFLCSHAGIKGTSRPTHYHVLRDDNKFTADALQSLTNNLCYTYASCTRSVSIAPPVYYAHKLAFRARFYQTQGSDVESVASSGSTTQPGAIKALPEIKDEVKRLMFYC